MSNNQVPAVEKAIKIMSLIAETPGAMTTSDLARSLKISQATCYRIIQTLVANDWISPCGDGGYVFSRGLHSIARQLFPTQIIADKLQPALKRLVEVTGITAKISVRQGNSAVSIVRVNSSRPMALNGQTGSRFPLALGSSGAALLSNLEDGEIDKIIVQSPASAWQNQTPEDVRQRVDECRREGVCSDNGSYRPYVHTLSAPIRNGKNLAVITLLGLPDDFAPEALPELKKVLKRVVNECECEFKKEENL